MDFSFQTPKLFLCGSMLKLLRKDLKSSVISLFKELKETMLKEAKEAMMTKSHQTKRQNIKKGTTGNSEVEKYNNNEKFTGGVHQQI